MDKAILSQWLKSGYMENGLLHATIAGTPQDGNTSPIFANIALDGLEDAVRLATKWLTQINVVRYADDFIITAVSPDILENRVKPAVQAFLTQRGLSLSEEKTHITHINTGFDFLGFNVRKYQDKLLIKPVKASIKRLLNKVRVRIKSQATVSANVLIRQLNPIIRGWANYYRHVVSKVVFYRVDTEIFKAIYRWIKRKHKKKNAAWLKRRYFTTVGMNQWRFFAWDKDVQGNTKQLILYQAGYTVIKRHVKIRSAANPFLKEYAEYFKKRSAKISAKPWWMLLHLLPVQFYR